MSEAGKHILTVVLTSAPLWGAVGIIGGAVAGYYQGTNKDSAGLVIELTKSANSVAEKEQIIDLLISRGLLKGLTTVKISEILEKNARVNGSNVPSGLVCKAIWCSLTGQVRNIKRLYSALGFYTGALDNSIDDSFANATLKYQTLNNLEADGIIGGKTFALIRKDAARLSVQFE